METIKGIIFDIKKFAIHDGPGIRTTVFFKGCPLNCWWCHNPEAIKPGPELVWYENKCIHCKACVEACPQGAHEWMADDRRILHRDRCDLCGKCVEECYAEALILEGREVTVEEVMVELRSDIPFYRNSGGGITLSGGEPLFQHEFALAILRQCKSEGLHTAIDTTGQTPWNILEKMLPYIDLVLYDIKQFDRNSHKLHTGVSNDKILSNLPRIGAADVPIEIRIPIIPGINDEPESMQSIGRYLTGIDNLTRVVLLPFHKLGEPKYERLERESYRLKDLTPPSAERMQEVAEWLQPFDFEVCVG